MGIWTAFDSSPPRSTTTKRCVLLPENPNTVVSSSIYDRARCLPSHMYSFLTWYNNRRRFDDIHASTWEMVARIFDTQLDRCQVEYSSPDTSYCGSNEPSQISLVEYVMKEWQEPKWWKWAPPLSKNYGHTRYTSLTNTFRTRSTACFSSNIVATFRTIGSTLADCVVQVDGLYSLLQVWATYSAPSSLDIRSPVLS